MEKWYRYYKVFNGTITDETYVSFDAKNFSDEFLTKDCKNWALIGMSEGTKDFVYGYKEVQHPPKTWLRGTILQYKEEIGILKKSLDLWNAVYKHVLEIERKDKEVLPHDIEGAVAMLLPQFEAEKTLFIDLEHFLKVCCSELTGIADEMIFKLNLLSPKSQLAQYIVEYYNATDPTEQIKIILTAIYKKII